MARVTILGSGAFGLALAVISDNTGNTDNTDNTRGTGNTNNTEDKG